MRRDPRIVLRPCAHADAEMLAAAGDPTLAGEFSWWGFRAGPEEWRARIASDTLLSDDRGVLVVEHEGQAICHVSWYRVRHGGLNCWNIGIWLQESARGQGLGSAAQSALVSYLFDTTPMHRIEASTDVDNVAEQRALETIGFTKEGVRRGAGFRAGRYRDVMLYSILRTDLVGEDSP
jgi:RimJ/RimL family protein N-acetyltransferase